jgi:hypothetical protein
MNGYLDNFIVSVGDDFTLLLGLFCHHRLAITMASGGVLANARRPALQTGSTLGIDTFL